MIAGDYLFDLPRAARFAALLAGLALAPCVGADLFAADTVSDAKDPDFAVQGEYVGEIEADEGAKKIGVQVIALGNSKFRAVAYFSGLPGDGYDNSPLHETEGETKDGVTLFQGEGHVGRIESGTLTITVPALNNFKIGTLKKTLRESPTLGAAPPAGATVLFGGSADNGFDPGKTTPAGLLLPGQTSKQKFQSGSLHVEFQTPFMPTARGQGRGNSGVYLQGRYETQVLDSFGLKGENNECGGIYSISAPSVNMCFPPLSWQTYDIDFTAARHADGKKVANAVLTVRLNGVVVQSKVEAPHATTSAPVAEGPEPGPIYLQDHGCPVLYRNVWFVEKK